MAEQEDNDFTFRRLDEELMRDWMEDYGLGELWLKNVVGERPQ